MCSDCDQDPNCLPPCGCQDCADCVEPEITVVRRLNTINPCDVITETLKGIVGTPDFTCSVKITSVSISGSDITINTEATNQPLEYSDDNISFQDSPTFLDQPCGTRKYYVRQRLYTACIAGIYVTVSEDCECVPNPQPVNPPVTDCINGFVNVKTDDGCGNIGWAPTETACNQCDETFNDVTPFVTRCNPSNNKLEYFQVNGCGDVNWRQSQQPCNDCVVPTIPATAVIQSATCNQQGQIQANGSFTFGPVSGGNKYGIWAGNSYNGPTYDSASVIPSNNMIVVGGLQGQPYANQYVLRVFNQSNDCYIDKAISFPAVSCNPVCVYPVGTLFNTNPTCAGGASNNNGLLTLTNVANTTRYQVCQGTTFSCAPSYSNATPVSGPGPFSVLSNIGFMAGEQFKDYVVRAYNGSESCYNDFQFRFTNPCYQGGGGGCVAPSYSGSTANAATCSGTTPNNNASISITGVINASRFGYSVGTVYSGASYSGASNISGSAINIGFLPGSLSSTSYVVRIFSTTGDCFTDVSLSIPGANCNPSCVVPTSDNGVGVQATCTGSTVNNDASITIDDVDSADRYGYSQGTSYTGPAYSSASIIFGSNISITGLAGVSGATSYVVRIFNQANTCFKDVLVSVPGRTCSGSCTAPTSNPGVGNAATCGSGSTINNDASISIGGITNGTKYGYSAGTSYSGPAFASATNFSGSSISITGLNGLSSSSSYTVRIFNGVNDCFLDVTVTVPGKTCPDSCTNPTFSISSIPPTECVGEESNNNGIVRISSITNGTKYQICIDSSFSCTPDYAGSPTISGSGPIDVINYLGFSSSDTSKTVFVRVYNGSESCYTDHSIVVNNPCKSCCGGFTINSLELNNL